MVFDRLLLSAFRNMCKIHHVLNTSYCPKSHPSFCTMPGNLSQRSPCSRSWCSTFFYNVYIHYITHHVSFQQIIYINSSFYKQIPQLRSQKEKAGIAAGACGNSGFLYPWAMEYFSFIPVGCFSRANQPSALKRILRSRRAPWAVMRRAERVLSDSSRLGSSRPSPSASQVNRAGRSVQPT